MSGPTDDVRKVQEATDLVRLVGEHVRLKSAGREFVGLCPFHQDKSPSMYVSPAKQIFKCFACGAGGDCFSFMMKYHRLEFREALEQLAEKAHITLTPRRGVAPGASESAASARKRLVEANDKALSAFRRFLLTPECAEARAYVQKRGISPEMVEQFALGASPDDREALSKLARRQNWDLPALREAGVLLEGRQGGDYDRFSSRLIFPIHDELGRPVAFGGRILPEAEGRAKEEGKPAAKYLNSPEHALFNKSATLYGLWQARDGFKNTKTAIVVEGYMDVIACHQHGVTNAVAALGTSFTAQHAEKLRRYCDKVVFIFDGDAAGQKAADRAVGTTLESADNLLKAVFGGGEGRLEVAFALVTGGKDPDEMLSAPGGREAWETMIGNAEDAFSFLLRKISAEVGGATSLAARQRAAEAFLERLVLIGLQRTGGLQRSMIMQRLGLLLRPYGMTAESLNAFFQDAVQRRGASKAPTQFEPPSDEKKPEPATPAASVEGADDSPPGRMTPARLMAERQLISAILRDPTLLGLAVPGGATLDEALPAGVFSIPQRAAWRYALRQAATGKPTPVAAAMADLAAAGQMDLQSLIAQCDHELDMGGPDLAKIVREAASLVSRLASADARRAGLRSKMG